VTFAPQLNADDFRCFFAAGSGWGALSQKAQDRSVTIRLAVQHGQIPLRHLRLQTESGSVLSVTRLTGPDGQPISGHSIDVSGRDVHVDFGRPLLLSVGTAVSLELTTIPGTNK